MKILEDQNLDKYTTVHIGGTAKRILSPESTEELIEIIEKENPEYFIGGGSNLLIADREFDLVVDLRNFNKELVHQGDGIFRAGASVRLQELINEINECGYGGIEYLYSVPGLVGGAVVMNAGRGKKYNQAVSDYIISVDVVRDGKIVTVTKENCGFSYRNSIFRNGTDIVVSCLFKFPEMGSEESAQRKKERLELCRKVQDSSKPNFGTVFCESNGRIMNYVKKHKTGGKVHFSGKTPNWILNDGGSFDDAISAIRKVELYHKLLFKKCKREVIVWE